MAVSLPIAHTAANCRWSQPEFRLAGEPEWPHPDARVVCIRQPGVRRPATDQVCATCAFWEPIDGSKAGAIWVPKVNRA